MTVVNTQLERDYSITEPVAIALAEQMVRSAGQTAPSVVNLAEAITGIGEALTMQGAPQLQINLEDEGFALLDSGFWGASATHGRLRSIEINYPAGSKYWWRLRQVSLKADFSVETYWIPRVVRALMDIHKPVKASRGSRTRAEFLKMLCEAVPEIHFYSHQLDVKQPIASVKVPKEKTGSTSGAKTVGLSDATKGLTVQGSPMTAGQRAVAGTLLRVADKKNAGQVATEAVIYAAIYESKLGADAGSFTPNEDGYYGVLQGSAQTWPDPHDVVGMAEAFFDGGKGFQAGGAIALSHTVSNPIEVAVRVEVPSIWPANAYAQEGGYPGDTAALAEVKAIIEAGGGATGTGGITSGQMETVQQYNFETGTTEEPYENWWTAMNRLAQEVNWELVVDGPDIHYDSDRTLVRQELADTIERTDENVVDWEYDWDDHAVATNLVLTLVCDEFAFIPGDVVKVKGFGPAAEGSTMELPGRWLLGEAQRNPGDIVATLTLVQPTRPLKEPAPEVKQGVSGTGKIVVGQGIPSGLPEHEAGQYRNPPAQGPTGTAVFEGITMAKWIVPMCEYARAHGWPLQYKVTSGYRPGPDPHTATGSSEHQGTQYPHGAIDFGGFLPNPNPGREAFFRACAGYTGLPLIPAQFAGDGGHASGTGH